MGRLTEYAGQGFPIFFVGGTPDHSPYFFPGADEAIQEGVQRLLNHSSVLNLTTEADVVPVLLKLGITPAAQNLSPTPIIYVQRVDESNNVTYFWAYNSDIYTDHATEVVFKATGIPYTLDAWTGNISPVVNYTKASGRYKLWIDLRSNATTIIAFAPPGFFADVDVPSVHAVSTDVDDFAYSPSSKALIARTTQAHANHTIILSDGRNVSLATPEFFPASRTLRPWNLLIEDWQPNPDRFNNYTSVVTYHNLTLEELIPWPNITGLEAVSGIGTYTTTFNWPPTNATSVSGAFLDLGLIFMTARVWINDKWTGPLDVQNPIVDISPYLVNGTNHVEIVVSTTLRNRLIQVNVTQSWEQANYSRVYGTQPYGLTHPVSLKPYLQLEIPV